MITLYSLLCQWNTEISQIYVIVFLLTATSLMKASISSILPLIFGILFFENSQYQWLFCLQILQWILFFHSSISRCLSSLVWSVRHIFYNLLIQISYLSSDSSVACSQAVFSLPSRIKRFITLVLSYSSDPKKLNSRRQAMKKSRHYCGTRKFFTCIFKYFTNDYNFSFCNTLSVNYAGIIILLLYNFFCIYARFTI